MDDLILFILGLGFVLVLVLIVSVYEHIKKIKYIRKNIVNNYGKEIDIEEVNIKMNNVSSYFRNKNKSNTIDDITWNDLSMDDVFKKINNTQSTAGQEVLYDMLRNPIYDKNKLNNIDSMIEYFNNNEKERQEVQYVLAKLGKTNELYISNCLFNEVDSSKDQLLKYTLLSYLPIISTILIFINGYFTILLAGSLLLNIFISQIDKKKNYNSEGFSYIIGMVRVANKIKNMQIKEINKKLPCIDASLNNVKYIKKRAIGTGNKSVMSDVDIFSEYINMIFLRELKTYEKVKRTIMKNIEDFKFIYEYVGTIDALIAVASFRNSLDFYTKPSLNKSRSKDYNYLEFDDIYHPLIRNPVVNSAKFNKGVLLTGSNASGKSTFIKTIAINAIFAQTIYTCLAKRYDSSFFNIYTSMALKDDILSNESYYIVEIKSLKRILDNINNDMPCLCFVDEILRGTNTIERISASSEVLGYLGNSNTICISATHDIELTSILEDEFDNYHFEETITSKDIKFDYKLHHGKSKTRNAIKLLGLMGYDSKIVDNAEVRAREFLQNKAW